MDGDQAPLLQIVAVKQKYNCLMMVDEAHAIGVFGDNGAGLVNEQGLSQKVELIFGTFGKALGSFGAWLTCSDQIKDYLINFCRSFIYTTALPPAIIAANIASLDLMTKDASRRQQHRRQQHSRETDGTV